ncbi:hypothetical protein [Bifidobacterium mongoliense]|uniref:hypothetical protein n=1 Tax=Bifidobacterium mongoliense TaxID=518643 RepID=UPI002649514E|nr:hypothetical protein [Bifidobacterium mongoliense]MDN6051192.1 hypothetical protein [Bifidobacterium mongoliense]
MARWLPAVSCLPLMAEVAVMYARGQIGWPSLLAALLVVLACLGIVARTDFAWLVVFLWLAQQVLPFPESTSIVLPLLAALLIIGCGGATQGVIAALIASIAYLPALSQGGTADMPIDTILILLGFFTLATGAGIAWGAHQRRAEREQRRISQTYQRNVLRVTDRLHNSVANDLVYLDRVLAGGDLGVDEIEQARGVLSSALGKVHQVIDELSVGTTVNADVPLHSSQEEELRHLCSAWDRKLADAAFTGVSLMDEGIDLTWMSRGPSNPSPSWSMRSMATCSNTPTRTVGIASVWSIMAAGLRSRSRMRPWVCRGTGGIGARASRDAVVWPRGCTGRWMWVGTAVNGL